MGLNVGDQAPEFTLPDADGRPVRLSDYRGRRVILYFYPAAMTPGCTTQACDFRDNLHDLRDAGYDVLAVSPDPPEPLRQFRELHDLPFPLLSDPSHQVLAAYGAWGEKINYGRRSVGVIRSTAVVGPDGRLEQLWNNVRATGHVKMLRERLDVPD